MPNNSITLRIPTDLLRAMEERAEKENRTRSNLILTAIKKYLETYACTFSVFTCIFTSDRNHPISSERLQDRDQEARKREGKIDKRRTR